MTRQGDSEIVEGSPRHVTTMRRILAPSCLLTSLLVGCGFDTVSTDPSLGGSSTAPTAGASGGGAPSNGGNPATAGQPTGTAGSDVTPQGGTAGSSGAAPGGAGPTGGGGASTAGAGGSGGGSTVDSHFKLLWRDDFDTLSDARWAKATHTFEENLARFTPSNVVVEGGFLKLKVTKVQNGDRNYSAAEVYTKEDFKYGRFEGRIKFCAGGGMVSSMFTYKDDVNQSWQEIDIEHLGYLPKSIQYNLISGNLENRKYQPKVVNFQFSPTADFHDYAIEWKPDGVTFYVDGTQTHHDVQATLQDSAKLRMNAWPTNNAVTTFAGTFDPAAVPCEAQYDWVQVYSYAP